ncbi:MAG: hypothetical protein V3R83_12665 [Gammaproteobacteria bacterium]
MDFSDNKHSLAELVFQGAIEVDCEKTFTKDVIQALATWSHRRNRQLSGSDLLRLDGCTLFSINYEGKARDYWPNESENDISETLIREFLYRDGICSLSDERIRLFCARYKIMALTGDEYLLVCPYLTEAANISGIVVVTVTKMIR